MNALVFTNGNLTWTNTGVPKHEKNGTDTKENKKFLNPAQLHVEPSQNDRVSSCYMHAAVTRTVPLGGSFQYSECRAWKACLIRGCVKQCCCGTPPGAAESFTAVSQSLGLWLTTSGVNWRDKPSSIQALTPLRYYSSLLHAT